MISYIVYNVNTGLIERAGTCPRDQLGNQVMAEEEAAMVADPVSDETHIIDPSTGKIRQKPSMEISVTKDSILADGIDSLVVSGIPHGASVNLLGAKRFEGVVNDGVVEVTTTRPGRYSMQVSDPRYIGSEVFFNAY